MLEPHQHYFICDVIGVLRPSREIHPARPRRSARKEDGDNEPALHADLPQHHAIAGVLAPHRPGIISAILSERRGGEDRERERDDIVLSKERARLWGRQASIGTRAAGRRPPSSSVPIIICAVFLHFSDLSFLVLCKKNLYSQSIQFKPI